MMGQLTHHSFLICFQIPSLMLVVWFCCVLRAESSLKPSSCNGLCHNAMYSMALGFMMII